MSLEIVSMCLQSPKPRHAEKSAVTPGKHAVAHTDQQRHAGIGRHGGPVALGMGPMPCNRCDSDNPFHDG